MNKRYLIVCENIFGGRILTIDEATEKRWLFDTLRYNIQNFSNELQLENKDFESSIDKHVSSLLRIRTNLLALAGFVATIAVSLGTTSLLNHQQLLWILIPDFVVWIAIYLIMDIVLIQIQKVLSPIRKAHYVTENITQLLKGLLGSVSFILKLKLVIS